MSDMTVMGGFACAPIASLVHSLSIVMAGLVPASTPFPLPCRQHVDARDKHGYDGGEATRSITPSSPGARPWRGKV